jgi:FixJ family two-component response regulator
VPNPPLIAIVEDDDSLREAVAGLAESMGHEAVGFASAEAFLEAGINPACIITDITLPGLSGIELKQALDAAGGMVPVIIITARLEEAVLEKARASGALCVLRKPFTPAALIDCLERALAL